MSGAVSTGGPQGRGGANQDFELNLASIIDCFTVLIAFMLASASFLSISILDAGVAASGSAASGGTPPPVSLTVELKKDATFSVRVEGKEKQSLTVQAKSGQWDQESLTRQLTSIKSRWPGLNAVILTAENDVEYSNVVQTMQIVRKTLPAVMLGGF